MPTTLATRAGRVAIDELRTIGRALVGGVQGFYKSDDLTFASSIAYFALLSFFPSLLLAFAVLGRVAADEADRAKTIAFALQYFPGQFDFITRQLDQLRVSAVSVGATGAIALVWASLGFFGALTTAVDHAWAVERPRSYWRHKWFSIVLLMAVGSLLLTAVAAASAITFLESSRFATSLPTLPGAAFIRGASVRTAVVVAPVIVFGFIFYIVPNADVRFRNVWAGAVVTGVLWHIAFYLFSWYLHNASAFSAHGSIAAVAAFLFWAYVSASILLYGVEFTVAYSRLRADPLF